MSALFAKSTCQHISGPRSHQAVAILAELLDLWKPVLDQLCAGSATVQFKTADSSRLHFRVHTMRTGQRHPPHWCVVDDDVLRAVCFSMLHWTLTRALLPPLENAVNAWVASDQGQADHARFLTSWTHLVQRVEKVAGIMRVGFLSLDHGDGGDGGGGTSWSIAERAAAAWKMCSRPLLTDALRSAMGAHLV